MTLKWRHVFPNLGRNEGLQEMFVTRTAYEMEPNGFQEKVKNEQFYQTAISDFQSFEKLWNF